MKNKMNGYTKLTWLVTGIALALAIAGLFVLPEVIPVHFGPSGEPDNWGSRWFMFLYPVVMIFVNGMAKPMKKLDPKNANYAHFDKYYDVFFLGFSLFFLAVELSNMAIALGIPVNVGTIICFVTGVLMAFIGNMLPKIKQNFFFGIKVPWTISDEEIWFKTHRLAGKTFALGGIAMMLGAFIPGNVKIYILLSAVLVMTLLPLVYSVIIYLKKKKVQ